MAAVVIGAIVLTGGDDGGGTAADTTVPPATEPATETTVAPTTAAPTTVAAVAATTTPPETVPDTTAAPTTEPAPTTTTIPDPCENAGDEPCVRIDSIAVDEGNGAITINWTAENFTPSVADGLHAHLFWNDIDSDPAPGPTRPPNPAAAGDWDAVENTDLCVRQRFSPSTNQPPKAPPRSAEPSARRPDHNTFNHELFQLSSTLPEADG